MHHNAVVVMRAAAQHGLEIEPREFPEGTRTAQDAADAIGVDVGRIVKSLVFDVDGAVVLALVSGANRLDEVKLARVAGSDAKARRVDAERARAATGFPIGGVPPFGHPAQLPTFIDRDLLDHDTVWAAAGTPHHNFAIAPAALVRITSGTVADLRGGA